MLSKLIVSYDTTRFPFASVVAEHLGVEDLSQLHQRYDYPLFTRDTDQSTAMHRRMYQIGAAFHELYRSFLGTQVLEMVGEELVYQRIPNFRVQLPNNVGVGGFHRDRDNGHSPTEINIWIPLTPVSEETAVWLESSEGRRDFRPCLLDYGRMLVFDGANLEHGNHVNRSQRTRVSFDFRVVPTSVFSDSEQRSVVTGVRFAVGEYFERLDACPGRSPGAGVRSA